MELDLVGPDRNAVRARQEFIGAGQWTALDVIHLETKYYVSNAPAGIAPRTMADMSGQRWPIETIFEAAKGEVGMDHDETRTWVGWHHHTRRTCFSGNT